MDKRKGTVMVEALDRPKIVRLSVPGPGRTLSAITEERARHVRRAVQIIERSLPVRGLNEKLDSLLLPRWSSACTLTNSEPCRSRAAWTIVNMWLLALRGGVASSSSQFADAEDWFVGRFRKSLPSLTSAIPTNAARDALLELQQLDSDAALLQLLPYILEPHGPGSRLSVMRDPSTRFARDTKKQNGVFYTPMDVAEYMVGRALPAFKIAPKGTLCLDPCCGTGVFLVAILGRASQEANPGFDRLDFATRHLYGIDASILAIESCAFVLLHHCLPTLTSQAITPWCAWQALRLNLTVTDSLKLQRPTQTSSPAARKATVTRNDLRTRLLSDLRIGKRSRVDGVPTAFTDDSLVVPPAGKGDLHPVNSVFPEAASGFDVLVANPPYTTLNSRSDLESFAGEYASVAAFRTSSNVSAYLLFIEMMWRFARPGRSASAVVVPLSIAFHQGQPFRSCRAAMQSAGGRWQCSFFDREPHALFGEDVKTRNAILVRTDSSGRQDVASAASFETTPLRRWTSRTRDQLFATIAYTALPGIDASLNIPKLGGLSQANAYAALSSRAACLGELWEEAASCLPVEACHNSRPHCVFVATTAYNFLNSFRGLSVRPAIVRNLSQNRVHRFNFGDESDAELAFAIICSRLSFWLWHVQGDGFHVGRRFIERLPFNKRSFSATDLRALCQLGRDLWRELQDHRIESLNKGRVTIAFRPLGCESIRNEIDALLIKAAELPTDVSREIQGFVRSVVVVDEDDQRRGHLKTYFHRMDE